jgi:predicted ester cyclase
MPGSELGPVHAPPPWGPAAAGGLGGVVEALPDYHWDLRHLLVDGCWFSAHLVDTGTTPTGRSISIQEFAMYRVAAGRIVEVWGDLDRIRLAM